MIGVANAVSAAKAQQAGAMEWHIQGLLRLGVTLDEMEAWMLQGNPWSKTLVVGGVPLFTVRIDPETLYVYVERLAKEELGAARWTVDNVEVMR